MKLTTIIAVLAVVGLAGCQTPGSQVAQQGRAQLESAALCCKTIGEAKVKPLPVPNGSFELNNLSQVFVFDEGRAYFDIFELPPYVAPYSILISSMATGTRADRAVMAPRITLLDAKFQPTRHYDESGLRQRGELLERTLFINPANRAERYLVLYGSTVEHTRDSTIGVSGVTPVFAGPVMFMLPTGSDVQSSLQYAPTGRYFLHTDGLEQVAQQ